MSIQQWVIEGQDDVYCTTHYCIYSRKWMSDALVIVTYCPPPYLHLASSEMWCWSRGRGILKENCLCATALCTTIMMHSGTSSSYRSVDCVGLWSCLVWLSVFQAPLCLWSLWCCIYPYIKIFCLHPSLYLLVNWAWWDWPWCGWLTNINSVLWHCWLGKLTHKIVSKMTCNVSSGTINPAIPYHMIVIRSSSVCDWLQQTLRDSMPAGFSDMKTECAHNWKNGRKFLKLLLLNRWTTTGH